MPRHSLEEMIEHSVMQVAKKRLKSASHTMALEAQGVAAADESEQLKRLVKQPVEKGGSQLWEEIA